MIIFPAIDIQNGECVRLTKGDFATAERVAEDPVQTALAFKEAGAEWIHMVDLDGAKMAQAQNREVFISVAKATEMKIELGGGIRDLKTAEFYLENGIERVIVGSIAVRNPKLVAEMVREYGDRIVVGIDAENGMAKIDGWLNPGKVNFVTLAKEMEYIGVRNIIYTDISKDGTLAGPNLADLKKLRDSVKVNIVASGGITGIEDIKALAELRLYGAICGKSLYRGTLDLAEAIAEGAKSTPMELPDPSEEVEPLPDEKPQPAPRSLNRSRGEGRSAASSRNEGNRPNNSRSQGQPNGGRPANGGKQQETRSSDGGRRNDGGRQNGGQSNKPPRQEGNNRPPENRSGDSPKNSAGKQPNRSRRGRRPNRPGGKPMEKRPGNERPAGKPEAGGKPCSPKE